ncbi:MAG: hypothetical protein WAV28_17630 [Sedimentisphaerales bacterium]|jgi:hypothetical protein
MFDLNEQINKWRSNLAQSQTLGSSDIEELESHLREEIENLTDLKLSDEEAFLIATYRLGSTESLAEEYEKINRGVKFRHRLFWIATGVLGYFLATYLADAISIALSVSSGSMDYNTGVVFIVSKVMFWSIIVFLCYQLYKGDFDNLRIRQMLSSFKGKCILFAVLVIAFIMLYCVILFVAADIYSQFEITRWIMDHRDLEIIEVFWGYLRLVWSVMLPALLVILLIKLRRIDIHHEVDA